MLLLAVPLEIILPLDWFVVFETTLDSANPIVPFVFMCGFDMSDKAAFAGETLVANVTVRPRGDIVLRACCWTIDRNGVDRLLLLGFVEKVVGFVKRVVGFFPRVMCRVCYRRMGDVVAVA